jgi:hypothetical protein
MTSRRQNNTNVGMQETAVKPQNLSFLLYGNMFMVFLQGIFGDANPRKYVVEMLM